MTKKKKSTTKKSTTQKRQKKATKKRPQQDLKTGLKKGVKRDLKTEPERAGGFADLRPIDEKFVEGLCSGLNALEAARYAGSQAKTRRGLASHASRWRRRPEIVAAVEELRAAQAVDDEGLWDLAKKALRELIQDRANPHVRARACELLARLLGKLQPERHEHVHAHVQLDLPDPASDEGRGELVRLVRIFLDSMDEKARAQVVLDAAAATNEEPVS